MSEAKLCQDFRVWAEAAGWEVHPEVSNWDLVLVPTPGLLERLHAAPEAIDLTRHRLHGLPLQLAWRPGDQVGVQAKLLGNVEVLHQAALERRHGPAWRLVLVPHASEEFIGLSEHLGCLVAMQLRLRPTWGRKKEWVEVEDGFTFRSRAVQVPVSRQLTLPPIVTDLVAGGNSPMQLTPWRVKALGLCRLLRTRGWLTRADFKAASVDPRRWLVGRWLTETAESVKVDGQAKPQRKLVAGPTALPDIGWEKISAELAAKEQNR